ncbi:DUF4325 domain-containing protein [Candidatus Berkelbacteria bacterium]|nr:DUF4325 domain-containing protein [Candidatus Berkelbacteria bacterium]
MKKFGAVLTSRQAGREAYAAYSPHLVTLGKNDDLNLNFEGVEALSPSWADEVLTPFLERFGKRLILSSTNNPSVKLTIKTLEQILGKKFKIH